MLVGLDRLELSTSPLSGARSSHLSYRPIWWSWSGSNRRPPECKSGALPTELQPLGFNMGRAVLPARSLARRHDCPPHNIYRGRLDAGNETSSLPEKMSTYNRVRETEACLTRLHRLRPFSSIGLE